MPRQVGDIKELLEWVRLTLAAGDISFRPNLSDVLQEFGLLFVDVINILESPDSVGTDFGIGTYVFRGRVDERTTAVVIAERSEKNRIKIVKVWRE